MKSIALLAIALLVSCASSDSDIIDERTLGCEPGQDISIMAGMDAPNLREDGTDERFELIVNVSNNSHGEVTVTAIRAEQTHTDTARYRFESGYRKFDQVIEEGKDHTFRLPMNGRAVFRDPRTTRVGGPGGLELAVTVALSNGDSYRCSFEVGASR